MDAIRFLNQDGVFSLENPENYSGLYLPIAGNTGLKGAVTPNFGGDSKLDQETFLLEPVTIESLHNARSTRNFWCRVNGAGCWSVTGVSAEAESRRFTNEQEESTLTAGFLWQTCKRVSRQYRLEAEVTAFIPEQDSVELLRVRVRNLADAAQTVEPVGAIPIYGRSADNIRDHRNVTSMLHRIRTTEHGVLVKPTMSFDEKGHRENRNIYYVLGCTGEGGLPAAFYPTVDVFLGEGGTFLRPRAVYEAAEGVPAGIEIAGREVMGGIVFPARTLQPGETAEYLLLAGVSDSEDEIARVYAAYGSAQKAEAALSAVRRVWQEKVNVRCHTANEDFDRLMRWVSFQPMLRRMYGCSFLPHHDYGRGGRGRRDLWQDCLSLLLMDPDSVGGMIKANFGGVRVDGTNATIIGAGDGNFIADRNGIARVWMDHALWPLMTTKLYIDQTGDLEILNVPAPYFKDAQAVRGTQIDTLWSAAEGNLQKTEDGGVWQGSILEHLLLQHLTAFYEVGAHNIFRLRGADWNDALDMAAENGESVAFTCAYAGNLRDLAMLLRRLVQSGQKTAEFLEEIGLLLSDDPAACTDAGVKNAILHRYAQQCRHSVSGRTVSLPLAELADHLDSRAEWLRDHLRRQEWIDGSADAGANADTNSRANVRTDSAAAVGAAGGANADADSTTSAGWFNSYYDDHGRRVEGFAENGVRMMLTGQVFAVMSGTATDAQVRGIIQSADRYLYQKEIGGYRLNTDFHELKFDMGRMFGFAYGEKENGAVFSHMAVMYANALYRRGFVRAGYKALVALADTALDFKTSRMYPGIPEYFNNDGRGLYCYLTGAASWYLMTMITEVFGVRGEWGDLVICPKLVCEQFDAQGTASISLSFAGKQLCVTVVRPAGASCASRTDGPCDADDSAGPGRASRTDGAFGVVAEAEVTDEATGQTRALLVVDGRAVLRREELMRLPESGSRITVRLA